MPKTTKTLYRINLRVNQPRQAILEKICVMARERGIDLDPNSARCVWWGLHQVEEAYQQLVEEVLIKKKLGWRK